MRILFLSNLYPPHVVGGYERLCCQVAEALGQRGHDIYVLTSDFRGAEGDIPGQTVRRSLKLLADSQDIYVPFNANSDERAAINGRNIAELKKMVAETQPDIVFVWNLHFFDVSLQHALSELRVPSVFFLTDNWLAAALEPDRIGAHFSRHVFGSEPFLATDAPADHRISHAAFFGSAFVRDLYHSCGFTFRKERVIHNGVTAAALDDDMVPDRSQLCVPGELRLLFAGRLVDIKGPQDCIAALPLIQNAVGKDLRVTLRLVGDATDAAFRRRLDDDIRRSPLAGSISVQPPVSEGELPDVFAAHDMYLFPSLYEPFALTLILAMAAGIPVVASDVGGNPEIVLRNRTGMLYRKSDVGELSARVAELAANPVMRGRVADRGRRFAQRFTFARMVRQIEGALQDMAN